MIQHERGSPSVEERLNSSRHRCAACRSFHRTKIWRTTTRLRVAFQIWELQCNDGRTLAKVMDEFWRRLVHGMAPYLRTYNKWITRRDQVKVGDVVCLLEEHPDPNSHQRLAVIVEVTPGSDDIVRRIKVRTQNGKIYDRALNRIYVVVPVEQLNRHSNLEEDEQEVVTPPLRRSSRLKKRKRNKQVVLICKG